MSLLLFVLVFVGVFALVALVALSAFGGQGKSSEEEGQSSSTSLGLGAHSSAAPFDIRSEFSRDKPALKFEKNDINSAIPWLNDKIDQLEIAPRIRMLLYQAGITMTPSKFLLISGLIFFASLAGMSLKVSNFLFSIGTALAVGSAPFLFALWKRSQRFDKFEAGLPEALDMMVSALRAGHSLNAALGHIARECEAPIGTEFQICFAEQNYGLELRDAMENLTVRMPVQDLKMAVTAILIQKETGGNLAEVLNNTSEVIRERFRLKRQVKVHTAHGRMSGMIVTSLPFILLAVLTWMNPERESVLWTTDTGRKLLMASGAMMAIGVAAIQKIIRVEV